MAEPDTDLDRSLAELFAAEAPDCERGDADEIAAYLAGELPPERAETLRDHLADCRQCLEVLLDLEALATPEAPADSEVVDFELAAAWRDFEQRQEAPGEVAGDPHDRSPSEPAAPQPAAPQPAAPQPAAPQPAAPPWFLQAAAVVLLIATSALSVRVVQLEEARTELQATLTEVTQPQRNVPILYLDTTRDQSLEPEATHDRPQGDSLLIVLTPAAPDGFAAFEIEIVDGTAQGASIWSGGGFELSDHGSIRLGLSRRFLPAGAYRVRLYGLADGDRKLLEDYPIEIR